MGEGLQATMEKIRVAVIGAGAAGLATVRQLSKHDIFQPTVFEAGKQVGGTWIYQEMPSDFDPTNMNLLAKRSTLPLPNCHSSMYKGLQYVCVTE